MCLGRVEKSESFVHTIKYGFTFPTKNCIGGSGVIVVADGQ